VIGRNTLYLVIRGLYFLARNQFINFRAIACYAAKSAKQVNLRDIRAEHRMLFP
jgi:hypothetical protein